jgi:hypothetical protein
MKNESKAGRRKYRKESKGIENEMKEYENEKGRRNGKENKEKLKDSIKKETGDITRNERIRQQRKGRKVSDFSVNFLSVA